MPKFFVCVAHVERYVICLKATSRLDAYKDRPEMMAGVVLVPAGTHHFFNRDTIIQPDNQIPIPYFTLTTQAANGEFEILGPMYDGFVDDLVNAATNSHTMPPRERERLLKILGC